jgi:hypothetical protein
MTRFYKRIVLAALPEAEAEGWRPVVTTAGSVGADPFAAGTQQAVLVARDESPGYEELRRVLETAAQQAAQGKGVERHAVEGEAFEEQQIVQLGVWLGTNHFELGQAVKKAIESVRLEPPRARAEILGAINYLAAAVLVLERLEGLEPEA